MTHPDSIEPTRGAIRQAARRAVAQMSASARSQASASICEHLLASDPLLDARGVMLFWPLERADGSAEPDIRAAIERLLDLGRTVCLPRTAWERGTMEAIRLTSIGEIEPGRHGLHEPAGLDVIAPDALDVVVTPGVAFDRSGARLGHGRGFYDRYLSRPGVCAVRVGVGFEASVVDAIPASGEDVPMQLLVTEAGVSATGIGGWRGDGGGRG